MILRLFRLDLVFIRGKRGNKVAILLTKTMKVCIEALIRTRNLVGVQKENKYIFAAPTRGSLSYLRGNDCMAKVVEDCGLKCPQAFKSIPLRKYIATVSQVLDLKDNEVEWLARHMGHDVNIHKKYYRLKEHTLELAKVSKLLLAVESGTAANFIGKTLDELQLEGNF